MEELFHTLRMAYTVTNHSKDYTVEFCRKPDERAEENKNVLKRYVKTNIFKDTTSGYNGRYSIQKYIVKR